MPARYLLQYPHLPSCIPLVDDDSVLRERRHWMGQRDKWIEGGGNNGRVGERDEATDAGVTR
jgi:hypothetical protein